MIRTHKNKNRNKKKRQIYSLNSNPQRYGPGSNVSVINVGKSVNSVAFGRFALQNLLEENDEFTLKKDNFKFFRIEEIRAVFLPANVTGSFPLGALNMSWNLTSISTSELLKDDATKYFPIYRTKNIVFRYLPPRTVLDVQSIAESPPNKFFDFSKYLNCDTVVNFPGWLYVWNPSNVALHFDFQAVVRFRGNDFNAGPSKTLNDPDMFSDKMFLCDPQGNTLKSFVIKKEDKKNLGEDPKIENNKTEVPIDQKLKDIQSKQMEKTSQKPSEIQFDFPYDKKLKKEITPQSLKKKIKKEKEKKIKFQPEVTVEKIPDLINEKDSILDIDVSLTDQ